MGRANDRCHRLERRYRGEQALADDRVRPHQPPLVLVERPGLSEHEVGDRDLADIVQLRCEHDQIDLVDGHPEREADAAEKAPTQRSSACAGRALLLDDGEQQVAHLEPRGAPVAVLPLVHPPVCERERGARGPRLVRDQRDAVRTTDGAGFVRFAERTLELR